MKILMTADTVGGVWTYALELCRELARRGASVLLATQGARLTPDQWDEARALAGVEVRESDFTLEWKPDPWEDVARASEWLRSLVTFERPDLVHLNDYARGALSLGVPTVVVGHSCVLSWWEAVRRTPPPPEWDRYRREVTAGLAGAGAVVAPSRAMLRALERHYGPLRDARVILNGRDPALHRPAAKEPFVLTAGRLWDEAKNVSALEAVAEDLPWPVYLAGEGPGRKRGAVARRLGRLSSRELAAWFARASIYALPARYEPFGLSVLEAAQAGCALVLGDIDSLRELWSDAAVFVPPEDPGALRDTLCSLIADPARRDELARRARRRALERTPEAMAEDYLALYRQLLGASGRHPASEGAACGS